ncbi:hypothetical protein TRIUR3_27220 [Triticum urartu]|uniref:Uncharacterized protein n=1 Tax=Triticum urartu TaxID=4572 RepID=M7ZQM1_TRIUA|nr:hypothetical protein TRIUR3_27220 [Triticum urartu]
MTGRPQETSLSPIYIVGQQIDARQVPGQGGPPSLSFDVSEIIKYPVYAPSATTPHKFLLERVRLRGFVKTLVYDYTR